jgi:hypothetical protein
MDAKRTKLSLPAEPDKLLCCACADALEEISLFNGKISVINSFLKGHDIKIIEPIINKKISII